ncbi:hypothetical protein LJC26_05805, partial [Desulfovibrio sp. OttesenSCG-928-O18]|nr:hypothetical protein [Desulfovibrio sp. OttesenSCG-928-O18]
MGAGNDTVEIVGDVGASSWGIFTLDLGAGNDSLSIGGDVSAGGNGKVTIDLGEGNDTLSLAGVIQTGDTGKVSIDLGEGNDLLVLQSGFSITGDASLTGGTGVDTINLDNLGDTINLSNLTASGGKGLSGFEILSLSARPGEEGHANELVLDAASVDRLLEGADNLTFSVKGISYQNVEALRVTGNAEDSVNLTDKNNWNDLGTTKVGGVTYEVYTTETSDEQTLYLLLQTGLV